MLDDVGLHDATLLAVLLDWEAGTCVMTIRHSLLSDCALTFTEVTSLTLPRAQPWGPSQSINAASERKKGQFEIVMQSGDLIRIKARNVRLIQC